ncbi:hypothetical protein BLS_007688 [Venturia inaequalis]|uniref:C2H2-type domain-containing protein n=1 Tax=Venturia inaequalis TaxID=5025 RepID=A0A8H3VMJ7_VENIN|nr:hypothetical protein BLS_007688 [Venturia inaequalis]KAE9989658.1 hypothetical protein EG327_002421 [Venturia inaequalis]
MANRGKLKCTFAECYRYFSSEKEMRKHKRHSSEHDYCAVCDEDFLDWDDFSAHNALYSGRDSNKKSVKEFLKAGEPVPSGNKLHMYGCAKCGELFKTESGRQRHTDGAHQVDQNIKCPGSRCPEVFPRAAGLIMHIEEGRCCGITAAEFKGHLQHKILVARLLQDPQVMETLASTDYKSYLDAAFDDQPGGGVPLIEGPIKWDDDHELVKPILPEKPKVSPRMPLKLRMWPEVGEANGGGVNLLGKDMENLSVTTEEERGARKNTGKLSVEAWPLPEGYKKGDPLPLPPKAWTAKAAASKELFPGAKPTPPPSDWDGMNRDIVTANNKTNLLHYHFMNPAHRDIERFYNPLIEKYKCPMPDCIEYFETAAENAEHLENVHPIDQRRCPRCQKWFKSYAALISHCEAPNSRCGISYTDKYGLAIDEFSGGFLRAEPAARPDLTAEKDGYQLAYMKYEACVPHDWEKEVEKTIIGTEL